MLPLVEALQGLGVIRRNSGESDEAIAIAEEMFELTERLEGPARE